MAKTFTNLVSGAGKVGSSLLHGDVGTALGTVGKGIGSLFGNGSTGSAAGSLISSVGKTGQPLPFSPQSIPASFAQATPAIKSITGGVLGGGSPTSAASLASDLNLFGSSGSSKALNGALNTPINPMAGLAPSVADIAGSGLKQFNSVAAPATATLAQTAPSVANAVGGNNGGLDFKGIGNFLTGTVLPAAVMARSVQQNSEPLPHQADIEGIAANQAQLGNSLTQGALANIQGQLPGGAEVGVTRGTDAARAAIRSRYAQMGLTGSTMEGQDLARAEQAAAEQRFTIGNNMAATSLQAAGNAQNSAAQLYDTIMRAILQKDRNFSEALAGFAGAGTR